jgi:hypothetical protein
MCTSIEHKMTSISLEANVPIYELFSLYFCFTFLPLVRFRVLKVLRGFSLALLCQIVQAFEWFTLVLVLPNPSKLLIKVT